MEFTQLKSFVTAAQTLNFSEAADLLGYSQSAITVHIQQLESELGCLLFERIGRKVYLSQDGQAFYKYADQLLHQAALAKSIVSDRQIPHGLVRVGLVESISQAILPDMVRIIHKNYPDIQIKVSFGTTDELQALMTNHQLDLIITLDYLIHGHEWVSLCQYPQTFHFVSSQAYRDQVDSLTLEDLVQLPMVLTQKASYRFELEQILAHQGLVLNPFMEISDPETILDILRKGTGISFLPSFTLPQAIEEGAVCRVPIEIDISNIYIQAFHHQSKIITPALQVFIDAALDHLDKLCRHQNKLKL